MVLRPPVFESDHYQSESSRLSFAHDRIALVSFFLGSVLFGLSFATLLADILLVQIAGITSLTTRTTGFVPLILCILVFPLKAAAWSRLRAVSPDHDETPQGKRLGKIWLFGMRAELYYYEYQYRVYSVRFRNIVDDPLRASKKANILDQRAQKAISKAEILRSTLLGSRLSSENHYSGLIYSIFRFLSRKLDSELEKSEDHNEEPNEQGH